MPESDGRKLVVKITCGQEEAERCSQGFTVAATAVTAGVATSVWLTGEATWLVVPGRAEAFHLDRAAPLTDLLDAIRSAGRITVCTQCAARRGITESELLDGVSIAGAASFVAEVTAPDVQALVY